MLYRCFALIILLSFLASCGVTEDGIAPSPYRVALALGRGGLGDRSFNDGAYKGLERAQSDFGILFDTAELQSDMDAEISLRQLATDDFDLIIMLGQEYQAALIKLAPEFPQQRFAIIDSEVDASNVTSIIFSELEGDFLAGALTALMSSSDTVGFIGGADIEAIRRIEYGWRQGVSYIKPEMKILSAYLTGADDFSGFSRTDLGSQKAQELFTKQADILYIAAGRAGLGSIDVASQLDKMIVTTGDDQRWIDPVVLTSRIKNMDEATWLLVSELSSQTLAPRVRVLDYFSHGILLAPLDSPRIPDDVRQRMQALEQGLIDGTINLTPFTP